MRFPGSPGLHQQGLSSKTQQSHDDHHALYRSASSSCAGFCVKVKSEVENSAREVIPRQQTAAGHECLLTVYDKAILTHVQSTGPREGNVVLDGMCQGSPTASSSFKPGGHRTR